MSKKRGIPVIDIFAGPGGLGEGFSRLRVDGQRAFRSVLAVEKDQAAHRTLTLRSFYRCFNPEDVPSEYFDRLRGTLTTDELFALYPREAAAAKNEAWLAELGSASTPASSVRERVAAALNGARDWVLIGGPPCQAYSLVGRSRNQGIKGYRFEADKKATLYLEYLQLIADFWPAVFVMENVKGLLSAKLNGSSVFDQILNDLADPAESIAREGRVRLLGKERHRYDLYPIVAPEGRPEGTGATNSADYIVRADRFGVPQARHRIIIVGVRRDFSSARPMPLAPHSGLVSVRDVIKDLPKLRSGLSRGDSVDGWVEAIAQFNGVTWQRHIGAYSGLEIAERVAEVAKKISENASLTRNVNGELWRSRLAYRRDWYETDVMSCVANHEARTHMPSDLLRYLFSSCFAEVRGRSPELRDFPKRLLPAHENTARALAGSHFNDRFRVQLFDRPSTTVTSHISRDGHYYIHPDPMQCRSLTVREAARLQTFPDTYIFEGNRTAQYTQVGNAVPPLLAHQIAGRVFELFK